MTDSPEKKPTMANVGDTDSAQGSTTDVADARVQANEKPAQTTEDDDQYPSILKMVLLSSAALVVIFLIALDQASNPHAHTQASGRANPNSNPDHRRHGYPKDNGRVRGPQRRVVVRSRLLHDLRRRPAVGRQAVQVLRHQVDLPGLNAHLRARQPALRRGPELEDHGRRPRHRRPGRRLPRRRRLQHRVADGPARQAAHDDGRPRHDLRRCRRHRAATRWRLHRQGDVEVVFLH